MPVEEINIKHRSKIVSKNLPFQDPSTGWGTHYPRYRKQYQQVMQNFLVSCLIFQLHIEYHVARFSSAHTFFV